MSVTNSQLYLMFFLLMCSSSSSALPFPGTVLKFCMGLLFPGMTISIRAWVKSPKIPSCTQEPAWIMLPVYYGRKPGIFDGSSEEWQPSQTWVLCFPPLILCPSEWVCGAEPPAGLNHNKHAKEKWTLKVILKVIFQFIWQDLGQTCAHKHL